MHNRKPLILREHKLGLELWCVKLLFHYSYNKLMQWKMKELDRRTLGEASVSLTLVLLVADWGKKKFAKKVEKQLKPWLVADWDKMK